VSDLVAVGLFSGKRGEKKRGERQNYRDLLFEEKEKRGGKRGGEGGEEGRKVSRIRQLLPPLFQRAGFVVYERKRGIVGALTMAIILDLGLPDGEKKKREGRTARVTKEKGKPRGRPCPAGSMPWPMTTWGKGEGGGGRKERKGAWA